MIINKPATFSEAVNLLLKKKLMPTRMSTATLDGVAAGIKRASMFSARVNNATFLQRASDLIARIVEPQAGGGGRASYMDQATARMILKDYLKSISYQPPATRLTGAAEQMTDLSSDPRLNLIIKTNVRMAQGFGQHQQANDPDVLDAYPAQELVRQGWRKVPRDWLKRWQDAGGTLYGGRMIARKDDPIWTKISRFGNPYPPFDFNSGMSVRPVGRRLAIQYGVIAKGDSVSPTKVTFAKQPAGTLKGLSQDITTALQRALLEAT